MLPAKIYAGGGYHEHKQRLRQQAAAMNQRSNRTNRIIPEQAVSIQRTSMPHGRR